jgi:hypothetical protein
MIMKFKVGDKVIGNHSTAYDITKKGWVGYVIKVDDCDGNIKVSSERDADWGYWVNPEYFDLDPNVTDIIVITTDGKITTATKYCEDGKKVTATAKCAPEDTFDFNVGAKLAMERLIDKVKPVMCGGYKVGDRVHLGKFNGTVICIAKSEIGSTYNDLGVEFDDVPGNPGMHYCSGIGLAAGEIGKSGRCKWCYPKELEHGEVVVPKYYNGKIVCVDPKVNDKLYTKGKIYEVVDGTFVCDNGSEVHNWYYNHRFNSFRAWNEFSTADWLEIKE